MRIRADLQNMASSEILAMIPPEKLEEIKKKDPKPIFKAFVIGHEGHERGNIIGIGPTVKRWFKDAIFKLHDKVKAGVQLFAGHGETNSQEGRTPIGEVVGKKLAEIENRISSVVACYIFPDFNHLPFDIASIEASVEFGYNQSDGLLVADVGGVSAIALANKSVQTPGFPGATLLGAIQAFVKTNIQATGGNVDKLTLGQLREAIQEGKFHPSDVFTSDALNADPFIKEQLKEKNRQFFEGRKVEEVEKELTKLQAELKAERDKNSTMSIEIAKGKVPSLLKKQVETRKLDQKAVKFIEARLPKFSPAKPDEVELELSRFLDQEVDEFNKIKKEVFQIEENPEGNGSRGVGPGSKDGKDTPDIPEHLDPEKNDWIPA